MSPFVKSDAINISKKDKRILLCISPVAITIVVTVKTVIDMPNQRKVIHNKAKTNRIIF